MGKSPGKWVKTLLFGKKASKSNMSKGKEVLRTANEKEVWVAAHTPAADLAMDPHLISHPAPCPTDRNEGNSEIEKGFGTNLPQNGEVVLPGIQDTDTQGISGLGAPNDPERIRQDQAATIAQAAFRGYLARRAFRALRGIIRLQGLIRGHLVRRQAIATLRSILGIIKLQALVQGRRVRLSDTGLEVHKKCSLGKPQSSKHLSSLGLSTDIRTEKLSANAFVSKLLASSSTMMVLRLQYASGESNSALTWLERWTSSCFWKPLPQPKRDLDSKRQKKQSNSQIAETDLGRPKRSVRSSMHSTSEFEKSKRLSRKVTNQPVETVKEQPQNELEKVKRSLRKVSNSTVQASSDQAEVETPKRSLRKASSTSAPDVSEQGVSDSAEKKDTIVVVSSQPDVETTMKSSPMNGLADELQDENLTVELQPLESSGKDDAIPVANGESNCKEDQTSKGDRKSSRRRDSFPAQQEFQEDVLHNTPTLPSYMAITESAKAKFRGQGSPRFGQDGAEKNGITRRYSLPSSTNGKLSLVSPRMQRLVLQASGKGVRNDKSLLSSRDANARDLNHRMPLCSHHPHFCKHYEAQDGIRQFRARVHVSFSFLNHQFITLSARQGDSSRMEEVIPWNQASR